MTTKVFKDSNRTTRLPFENMTLVVTRKDNGWCTLAIDPKRKDPFQGALAEHEDGLFLDAAEVSDLLELLYA